MNVCVRVGVMIVSLWAVFCAGDGVSARRRALDEELCQLAELALQTRRRTPLVVL